MSYEMIVLLMFSTLLLMLLTGQRVFGAIGFVASAATFLLREQGGNEMPFNAGFVPINWYPLLTLPLFIYIGYMLLLISSWVLFWTILPFWSSLPPLRTAGDFTGL